MYRSINFADKEERIYRENEYDVWNLNNSFYETNVKQLLKDFESGWRTFTEKEWKVIEKHLPSESKEKWDKMCEKSQRNESQELDQENQNSNQNNYESGNIIANTDSAASMLILNENNSPSSEIRYENKADQIYTPTKIRYILFPFKVLSLISLLSTIAFTYILYFSKLFKNLDSNQLLIMKLGLFGSFLIINLVTKLLQAAVSYIEVKRNYLVDKSLFVSTRDEKWVQYRKAIYESEYDLDKYDEMSPENQYKYKRENPNDENIIELKIKPNAYEFYYSKIKENNFSTSHKLKYLLLIMIALSTTTVFVVPFLLSTFSEKFKFLSNDSSNILNTFSKYFYTICFSIILILFILIHIARISIRLQNKVWTPTEFL